MKIDIFTLVIIVSIANLLEVTAFLLQYRLNRNYNGIGFWMLCFLSNFLGMVLIFLRPAIPVNLITIILANTLLLSGSIFSYTGVVRFFDREENRVFIISVFTLFIVPFLYFTYADNNISARTVIIYSAIAVNQFATAKNLFSYKTQSVKVLACFNSILFFTGGCFFSFRALDTFIYNPVSTFFSPSLMQAASIMFIFVFGLLLTIGLISMVNQRLLAENSEDKKNLELIFNTSPDAVAITRLHDGLIVNVNDRFKVLSGYSGDEIIGKFIKDTDVWCIPEDRKRLVHILLTKGLCENMESVFQRKDGSRFIGMISAQFINLNDTPHVINVTRDITDRKRVENALRESELKYRSLIENTNDVVFCVNDKGEYQFTNNVFASTFGKTPDYFNGKTLWDIYSKEEADFRQNVFKRVFETGEPQSTEVTVQLTDTTLYFLAKVNPIRDETGKIILVLTTSTNITDRKLAEEALRKSEEKYRLLIENSHDIIYTLTSDGYFTFASPSWTTILGHPVSQVVGQSFKLFVHPDDLPVCIAFLQKVLETGKRQDGVEYRVKHTNGLWYWHTSSAVPFKDDTGKVIGFEGTARDITDRKLAEEAFRVKSEELERYFKTSLDLLCIANIDGYFIRLNPEWEKVLGYSLQDLEGKSFLDFVHPDDMEGTLGALSTLDAQMEVFSFENRYRSKDGSYRWIEWRSRPQGKMIYAAARDITGRKQTEQALRESEKKYRLLTEFSSDVIWVLNLSRNMYSFVSPGIYSLRGLTVEEAMTEKLEDSLTEESLRETKNAIEIYLKEFLNNPDIPVSYIAEIRQPCKDGSVIWVEISCKLRYSENGEIEVVGVSRNIEKRKKIENELRESEEKLSTLFESMTEMVVVHELVFNEKNNVTDYRITDCNNAFIEVTGVEREKAVGRLASEVYNTRPAPYLEEYSRVGLTGKPYKYTTYFEPMDKYFSISVVSPKKNSFATITTDITGIRKIQEVVSAKNKELENYLYIASHDLRSPLVNIQGFSRRLQKHVESIKTTLFESPVPPEIKPALYEVVEKEIPKTLDYIFSSITKIDTLLNGLLYVSRTGRARMIIKEVDVRVLLKTVIDNYNFQLTEIDASVFIDEIPHCYGDEILLNQLFSNLIGNSIKYCDKNRKPVIEITGYKEFRKAVYSIRDNGIGIDKRHQEKIWDIFYRIDSKNGDAGEGIGLSIVWRIAEKHGGRVWVESEPGTGSTFYVELQTNSFSE